MDTKDQGSSQELVALRVDVHPQRDHVCVVPVGELDLATAPAIEQQLHELRDSGFDRIVLDLRKLTFMDSKGIALILAEDEVARSAGRELLLVGGPATKRILDACVMPDRVRYEITQEAPRDRLAPSPP